MVSLDTEEELLERIDKGLKEAVEAKVGLDWSNSSRIKRQKFTNMALDHYLVDIEGEEPPVTRSWFKYGETQPLSPAGPTRLDFEQPDSPQAPIEPSISDQESEIDDQDQLDKPVDPTRTDTTPNQPIFDMTESDFINFFRDPDRHPSLENHWNLPDLKFLKIYYEEHAPDDLRDVYLANVELRIILSEAQDAVQSIYDNRHKLYTEGESTDIPNIANAEYHERAGRTAVELRLAMRRHTELFEQSISPVHACTDLIEDTLLVLQEMPQKDINRSHKQFLHQLEEFYDNVAWMLAASEMSEHTAKGPHSGLLKGVAKSNFNRIHDNYEDLIEEMKAECARKGLFPSPADFSTEQDEAAATIDEIMSLIDRPRSDPEGVSNNE
ncbi:hypothetical protein [Natrinema altunense]|uniref:DUF8098 domain-containing protein n=1 Tax=Natrinema altunense TaxID=222984 RepID=A0A482Y0D7_9EURY|nr:hypothetical protein [Natrinema altunense]RZH67186.1 hypothetical protein ELS17_15680 [Natrinema altunense]